MGRPKTNTGPAVRDPAPPQRDGDEPRPLEELLIALSASVEVGYDAGCRLCNALLSEPPTDWTGAARAVESLAPGLGVRADRVRAALEVADRRSEIAGELLERARARGARAVTRLSPAYPTALLDLELPPPVLWVRGTLPSAPCVSIVGPRNADRWALDAARGFAHDLSARGLVVVSGFARGVDATAHRASLQAPGGRTVAVLGCGLDVDYPSQHHDLADPITESGAVVSEFACGTPPAAWRFPVRNRIIAALGLGTLVVQASVRSGSLITARLALELGRDVYAVPGRPTDRRSAGSNLLLRDGAHVALDSRSILETLPLAVLDRLEERLGDEGSDTSPPAHGATRVDAGTGRTLQGRVLEAIRDGGCGVEELARRLSVGVDVLLGVLLELELDGRVRRLSPHEYGPA